MPLYTSNQTHIDAALTSISVAYLQSDEHFIAGQVFKEVPVTFKSDDYYIFEKENFRRDEVQVREPNTESAGGGFNFTTDNYRIQPFAYHMDISRDDVRNSDPQIDLEATAAEYVSRLFLVNRERRWVTDYFTSGIWATDITGVAAAPIAGQTLQWNDAASNPELDIDNGRSLMLQETGYLPNTLVVSFAVHIQLKNHPLVKEQYRHTSSESITEEMLARFFEIDTYLVAKASMVTSARGAAATVNAMIAGNNALLTYVPPSPGLLIPAAGYHMVWTGLQGGSGGAPGENGVVISNIPMDLKKSDRIEGEFAYTNKLVGSDLGYFFNGIIA